jgi:hypothetical protein
MSILYISTTVRTLKPIEAMLREAGYNGKAVLFEETEESLEQLLTTLASYQYFLVGDESILSEPWKTPIEETAKKNGVTFVPHKGANAIISTLEKIVQP